MTETGEDRFTIHQRKAARAGGQSRSQAKIEAARRNVAKARLKRHNKETGIPDEPSVAQPDDLPPASQPDLEALDK